SETITILIVDDAYGESAETFNVTLSDPVGCTLGSPVAVAVTINSNETVNVPNPVQPTSFNNEFFVRQHYFDFLNRAPDAGGLAFWKDQLDACERVPLPEGFTDAAQCRSLRRINVSAAFFLSIEFRDTGYFVHRLYKTAYGDFLGASRLNEPPGVSHPLFVPVIRLNEFLADSQEIGRGVVIGVPGWPELLESRKQAFLAQFVLRSRFTTAFPSSMTATQFVDTLNVNAGNVLSFEQLNQLIGELSIGDKTRAQVLREVAEDPDLVAAERNRAFVLAQYFGYLRRNPNSSPDINHTGYDFWLRKLNEFNGNFDNAQMVEAFIDSIEYKERFGL
ncbi:MAG: DUF4214 domain-containing protein, partial [Acidobacteria bacterium]|nr:DUF4214 domain-containing protein [Acidobacteriota bacterium]